MASFHRGEYFVNEHPLHPRWQGGSPPRWWQATWHQTRSPEGGVQPCARALVSPPSSGLDTCPCHPPRIVSGFSWKDPREQKACEWPRLTQVRPVQSCELTVQSPSPPPDGFEDYGPQKLQWHEGDSLLGHSRPGQPASPRSSAKVCFFSSHIFNW